MGDNERQEETRRDFEKLWIWKSVTNQPTDRTNSRDAVTSKNSIFTDIVQIGGGRSTPFQKIETNNFFTWVFIVLIENEAEFFEFFAVARDVGRF